MPAKRSEVDGFDKGGGIFHTGWVKRLTSINLWQVAPIGIVLVVYVINQVTGKVLGQTWWIDVLLLLGWVAGWLLAEADHVVYATMCNPQELTCQRVRAEIAKKNWRNAWGMLQATAGERTKLPIRNVLTGFVMTGLGIWIVTSSGSPLAAGLIFGFCVRLFSEFLADRDYKNWYWIFAREFSISEHKGLLAAWAGGLIWQWLALVRG